jgi:hypothetical protein
MDKKQIANARWDKANTKSYLLKVMIRTEPEIIQRLAEQDNVNGYIKRLIREDIERSGT